MSILERLNKLDWGIHHIYKNWYLARLYNKNSNKFGRHFWIIIKIK